MLVVSVHQIVVAVGVVLADMIVARDAAALVEEVVGRACGDVLNDLLGRCVPKIKYRNYLRILYFFIENFSHSTLVNWLISLEVELPMFPTCWT